MQWDKPYIEIEVNDVVFWQWTAPAHIPDAKYTVLQTSGRRSVYDGTGFGKLVATSQGMCLLFRDGSHNSV